MKIKILKLLLLCMVLLQVPLFARGQANSQPIRKIGVISLLDESMCLYVGKKNLMLLTKDQFHHSMHLNKVIEQQFSSLIGQNYEVVPTQEWGPRLRYYRFPGIKQFWSAQESCDLVYQMVQESQVDAILFIHPYSRKDPTTEKDVYISSGGGGLFAGFLAGALESAIQQANSLYYMTAPELQDDYVYLHLNVGLYDVRGWKMGYTQIHPKKIANNYLDFRGRYRQDRISSTVSPTPNDQMIMCEVIRLCLPNHAAKTLSKMKLYQPNR